MLLWGNLDTSSSLHFSLDSLSSPEVLKRCFKTLKCWMQYSQSLGCLTQMCTFCFIPLKNVLFYIKIDYSRISVLNPHT